MTINLNSKHHVAFVLFTLIFLINLIIRWEIILSETLIADDLIYIPKALIGECIIPRRHPIDFYFFCYIFQNTNIFLGRIIFLGYLSITATIMFYTLVSFKIQKIFAFFTSISIFSGLPIISQVTFIIGSYPLHGIFFTTLALYFSSKILCQEITNKYHYIFHFLICLFFFLAGIAATSFTLISFVLIPCFFFFLKKRKSQAIAWLISATLPAVSFIFLQFQGNFSNHYSGLQGWFEISLTNVLRQINFFIDFTINTGGKVSFSIFAISFILSIFILSFFFISLFYSKKINNSSLLSQKELLIILLSITTAGFICVLTPIFFIKGIHYRYIVGPYTFLICSIFILIQLVNEKFQNKIIFFSCFLISLVFVILSISSFNTNHTRYNLLAHSQNKIKKFLISKKNIFINNSQVLIVIKDNNFYSFSSGFNHWSTHYARMVTGRQDIVAIIGKEKNMTSNPFTGKYSDHGQKYWKVINKRSIRKKMVGLDIEKPVYIYSLDKNGFTEQNCIKLIDEKGIQIYDLINNRLEVDFAKSDGNFNKVLNCVNYNLIAQ